MVSVTIFKPQNQDDLNSEIKKIKSKIETEGFEKVAKDISLSESAVKGGDLGWLSEDIISKKYLTKINKPVKISKTARIYSIIFFALPLLTNFLKPLPNKAQRLIVGRQIIAAVIVTKMTPTKIFSSDGKKPEATVTAIDHALGLTN